MFHVIIPARYASTRLPGKPLQLIDGKPMVQHVWQQACKSGAASVIVATDDQRIMDACAAFGARAIMTRADHPTGTDRLQEVVSQLGLPDDACVVNVQGDEPMIPPAVIDQVAANLIAAQDAGIATLAEPIHDSETLFNPNAVKVVCDHQGYALYFSRAPMPWCRDQFANGPAALPEAIPFRRHVGIYAYKVSFLHAYVGWPASPLETAESLEQLRALWFGTRIHVADACQTLPAGVDTAEDLERVRALLGSA
ncbi:3-deoxy-manno-octulosonate cytidylyltransferase [Halopseudomonas aestusnigri]|uniref:3-deoxy-manno-octulosonate cytidylyltransferase n=1 Tax=Halopseudomonas aestusnigri TaxID=857252 RepID=A0AAQ1JQW8_9GAMM|nr:3-deoxy-manno-octulosonate cytidylyltransferase [Halopseudomonas aestusnigri]SEG58487.1 3-deoxy-manno-octulosonate cytidylyltransferase (CMP-KDO synthetase) [Halopseudomonas aestusnigri]